MLTCYLQVAGEKKTLYNFCNIISTYNINFSFLDEYHNKI